MKLKNITGILFFAFLLSACDLMDGIDNVKPYYQLEEDNYVTNRKGAEQALNGIYQKWRIWELDAFRVHLSVLSGGLTGTVYAIEGFAENSISTDNEAIKGVYSSLYAVVNSSNYLIEVLENKNITGLDSVRKTEIVGECKFHRAFAHFMLLRQFGQFYNENSAYGIILRKEPYRPGTPATARNKVEDCYTFILEDLTAAGNMAPERVDVHSRISRLTAKALKSRVLLYQKKYPEAAILAKEVLDKAKAAGYEMMETNDWSRIFAEHYRSPETLFAPYTDGTHETCLIDIAGTSPTSYTDKLSTAWGERSGYDNDPRYEATFILPREDEEHPTGNGKYPNEEYVENSIGNGYIFLRLAEIYLIHAEAEARQGPTHYAAARTSLKVITDRAGYPENLVNGIPDNELLEAIRQHKWLELIAENGEEWFDLVRYTQAGDLGWGTIQKKLKKEWQLIAPIPKSAMTGNNKLEQNPQY